MSEQLQCVSCVCEGDIFESRASLCLHFPNNLTVGGATFEPNGSFTQNKIFIFTLSGLTSRHVV